MPALQGTDFARRPAERVPRQAQALLALLRAVPASWAVVRLIFAEWPHRDGAGDEPPAEAGAPRSRAPLALPRGGPASCAVVVPSARARGSPGELASAQKGCLLQHKDKDPSTATKPRLSTEIAQRASLPQLHVIAHLHSVCLK